MDMSKIKILFDWCVTDMCSAEINPNNKSLLCGVYESFIYECLKETNVKKIKLYISHNKSLCGKRNFKKYFLSIKK